MRLLKLLCIIILLSGCNSIKNIFSTPEERAEKQQAKEVKQLKKLRKNNPELLNDSAKIWYPCEILPGGKDSTDFKAWKNSFDSLMDAFNADPERQITFDTVNFSFRPDLEKIDILQKQNAKLKSELTERDKILNSLLNQIEFMPPVIDTFFQENGLTIDSLQNEISARDKRIVDVQKSEQKYKSTKNTGWWISGVLFLLIVLLIYLLIRAAKKVV